MEEEAEEMEEQDYGNIFRGLARAFLKAAQVHEENKELREMLGRYVEQEPPRDTRTGLPTFVKEKPKMPF